MRICMGAPVRIAAVGRPAMLRGSRRLALSSPAVDAHEAPLSLPRRLVTSAIVAALAVVLGIYGFGRLAAMRRGSTRSEAGALPQLVRAERAHRTDFMEMLRGFGRARALLRAEVVAEVDGVVVAVDPALEAGAAIAAGPPAPGGEVAGSELPILVRIDDRDLTDEFERARAEVEVASAEIGRLSAIKGSLRERLASSMDDLETAQRELDRIAPLVPATLTQSDLDSQRLQVSLRQQAKLLLESQMKENLEAIKTAEARKTVADRSALLAERKKGRAIVRAPFAGRIEARHVNVGERVRVGDPLFTIVDLSRVEVPVSLPASRYGDVAPGSPVSLFVSDDQPALAQATVDRVAPTIETADRTFYVYVLVDGTPTASPVPPGTHVLAHVQGRTWPAVVAVPRRAFLGDRLFIATPTGAGDEAIVSERTPQVLRFLAGDALVGEGLSEGEAYLVTNLESVAEGSRVRLAPEAK